MSSDWRDTTWGDLGTLEYGKAIRDYQNATGAVPVYGTNGPIGWHDKPLCPSAGVVIGRKGAYRGIHYSSTPFFVIDTAFYLKPKETLDTKWAYYCLLTYDINGMDSGSAIPSTSRDEFYKLPVRIPRLAEQQQIAKTLSLFDDRITLMRETNATLEAIAQALFKSWFVDFDPVRAKQEGRAPEGMGEATATVFPDDFEESALGLVPRGWRVSTVGSVVATVGGGTPDTKDASYWEPAEHCWTTPKDLSGIGAPVLLDTERKLSAKGVAKISSGLLPTGTLLMSSRAPIGYLAIAQTPMAINQGYIAMLPGSALPPFYMLFWCRQNMETIKSHANGSTFMEISKKAFRPLPILVPPTSVVAEFVRIGEALFARLVENERQSQTLAALRDTLLPRLISGQLRLPEAEAAVEEAIA
jgi:type I restriction enzyme, S subunit